MVLNHHKIRVIILDDEEFVCNHLKHLLSAFEEVEIAEVFTSPQQALLFLADTPVDLIFLDIQMPLMDGFEFLDRLRESTEVPAIIFVTGFEEFAVKAIKRAAFDFLIKPVNADELAETIIRFKLYRNQNHDSQKVNHLLKTINNPRRLKLKSKNGLHLIDPQDIFFAEAEGNYSWIRLTSGSSEMVTIQIGKLLEMLDADQFFRISRQNLINLRYLHRVDKKKGLCFLKHDTHIIELSMVRNKINQLLQAV
ncbi:MAG: response regulator transcription factor [Clostridia bacterium]|nr:response regulator transcription factor [Clostridia bacterium]